MPPIACASSYSSIFSALSAFFRRSESFCRAASSPGAPRVPAQALRPAPTLPPYPLAVAPAALSLQRQCPATRAAVADRRGPLLGGQGLGRPWPSIGHTRLGGSTQPSARHTLNAQ